MSAFAYIVGLSSDGGLPIFSRKKSSESLPFSVVGSLNGVHMFGKPFKTEIINTLTDDYVVAWKEFEGSVVLIGIAGGCSTEVLYKVLESIYHSLVLIVGIEEIKTQKNIERLKRELRICYSVIDRLLDSLDCGDTNNKNSSDIIGYVETILCPENHLIQIVLDSFVECVDTTFGCILIHEKIAVATQSWWTLHPVELQLLTILATSESNGNSKDIPVYLPYKSPEVAFRFVVCTLLPDIQLCCLCGPTPVLNDIEHSVALCFKSTIDTLSIASQCFPRNFPFTITVDPNIIGLLLINTSTRKYMASKNPQQTAKKLGGTFHRLDVLKTFFYRSVMSTLIFDEPDDPEEQILEVLEAYWCSEYHKCHAMKFTDNVLCILYNSSVPTHVMSLLTEKTFKQITIDKQIGWQ